MNTVPAAARADAAPAAAAAPDRTAFWLPLLQRLTNESPTFIVLKNADSAFTANGDIDCAADPREWDRIEAVFTEWARSNGLGPVIVCAHKPSGIDLCLAPADSDIILELDLKTRRFWRGATILWHFDLNALASLDDRGFRKLRPGAEGVLKLLLNATRWDGTLDRSGLERKGVLGLLHSDPEGAQGMIDLFGAAKRSATRLVAAVLAGGWDRGAALRLQTWFLLKALADPATIVRRLYFRTVGKRSCALVRAQLKDHRHIPADRPTWLAAVARNNKVSP